MRFFIVLAFVIVLGGCGESPRAKPPADTLAIPKTVRDTLPEGRYELPMPFSGAPHLFISLPVGYQVRPTGVGESDQFFIVAADDPSARDSTATTPGFLQIYVGAKEQRASMGSAAKRRATVIARRPMLWDVWDEHLPNGTSYHVREIVTREFFRPFSRELMERRLELHIYIAGADSAAVERLVTAAETISVTP